jgi:hypothetical protein
MTELIGSRSRLCYMLYAGHQTKHAAVPCLVSIPRLESVIWQILKVPRSLRQIEIMVAFAHDFTDQTFCTKLGRQV